MSPLAVRRYRAERLLRREFDGLRGRVLGIVAGKLRGSGVSLDRGDLEACYAQAWQGLYARILDGEEIANPAGWLVLVTYRRAIEEHRSRERRVGGQAGVEMPEPIVERDIAGELDDRARLRSLFEGLRGRLSPLEREAAVLCYLQGLSRAEAAERLGVSDGRMKKLMEGRGAGAPGVAGKVATLVESIGGGMWCEEQASLMRGLAFGILDPDGERYELAMLHRDGCPGCRAYVASLRGLSAVLPPALLPHGLAAGVLGHGAGPSAGIGAAAGLGAPRAIGASASGAAGGGWLAAGGTVGAKLVAGCLVAIGIGAGCLELGWRTDPPSRRAPAPATAVIARRSPSPSPVRVSVPAAAAAHGDLAAPAAALSPPARAAREFGPEQPGAAPAATQPVASTASVRPPAGPPTAPQPAAVAQAAREFSPG